MRTPFSSLILLMVLGACSSYAAAQCEVAKLYAPVGVTSDEFGATVAMNHNTIVVGAENALLDGEFTGAAYVFRKVGGGWLFDAELKPEALNIFDTFGASVAVADDLIAVGAIRDDDGEHDAGAVYIYRRDAQAGVWEIEAKLIPSDPKPAMLYGAPLAFNDAGDILLVGAPFDDDDGFASGAVYVYESDPDTGEWIETAKLKPSDPGAGHFFGLSLAIDGATALIGAPLDNHLTLAGGSAYVFTRDRAGVWMETAKLVTNLQLSFGNVGWSVAIEDDRVILGAPATFSQTLAGAAHVFELFDDVWTEVQRLTPYNGAAEDEFGSAVGLSGESLVIGARFADPLGFTSGSAYGYRLDKDGWKSTGAILPADGSAFDAFGWSVTLRGGAGVIGSPFADGADAETGAVYVYTGFDGSRADCVPATPGDLTGDGVVNGLDLATLLSAWGTPSQDADFNGDGVVDGADLAILLQLWS